MKCVCSFKITLYSGIRESYAASEENAAGVCALMDYEKKASCKKSVQRLILLLLKGGRTDCIHSCKHSETACKDID